MAKFVDITGLKHFWTKVKEHTTAPTINITWAELKALRDAGNLVPGQSYRITDYVTTAVQEETRSAGHQFDIIVTADDANTLNENAKAIQHEGDTYFADSKLDAWQLKYCLDNDITRFAWASAPHPARIYTDDGLWFNYQGTADLGGATRYLWYNKDFSADEGETPGYLATTSEIPSIGEMAAIVNLTDKVIITLEYSTVQTYGEMSTEEGKGVIYKMIDEYNNDYPYDFKNIQYKRYKCTADTKSIFTNRYVGCKSIDGGIYPNNRSRFTFNTADFQWCYTFNDSGNLVDDNYSDASLTGSDYNNKMPQVTSLPNCVMGTECYGATCGNDCYSWTCGNNCHSWTCGNGCSSWTCVDDCHSWTCGNYCHSWTCGYNCDYWTCGNDCHSWTCGNYCSVWTCGNGCHSWTCGNSCSAWTCGNNCYSWTCGNSCGAWTCGNYCCSWTCGNYCRYWTCGNYCYSWTCGNDCESWTCGNYCDDWTTGTWSGSTAVPRNYVRYFHLASGTQYVGINSSGTPTNTSPLKNFTVKPGIAGTYSSRLSIVIDNTKFPLNSNYEWTIAKNSAGEIKQYCEADLIN